MSSEAWLPLLVHWLQSQSHVVRVVVAAVRGSAPREPGATMLVSSEAVHGTIGGGRLEWEVLAAARSLLREHAAHARVCKFVLGTELGQCCGGVVEVWLELHTRHDLQWLGQVWRRSQREPLELRSTLLESRTVQRVITRAPRMVGHPAPRARLQPAAGGGVTLLESLHQPATLYVYGAGHVGRAVLRIVAELPWQVTCIDSRAELLHGVRCETVQTLCAPEPATTVAAAPAGCCFLVMTHSHALDYALVRTMLSRDAAWVGLIGSHSKGARFRAQLRRDGVPAADVERLVCPIGIGLHGKQPMAIAVSVVAQLLQHFETAAAEPRVAPATDPCNRNSCEGCGVSSVHHEPPVRHEQ
jgi:xanthine dehydrogenase accessory factor